MCIFRFLSILSWSSERSTWPTHAMSVGEEELSLEILAAIDTCAHGLSLSLGPGSLGVAILGAIAEREATMNRSAQEECTAVL